MRRLACSVVLVAACGGPAPIAPPRPVAVVDAGPPTPDYSQCTAHVDVADLLARHAKGYGTQESMAAALPLTLTYDVVESGKTGTTNVVVDVARWRNTARLAGLDDSFGVDERGPWSISQTVGVLFRPHNEREATSLAYEDWFLRRRYLVSSPSGAQCAMAGDKPMITLAYDTAQIGAPTLVFDLASAELVQTTHWAAAGRRHTVDIAEWSAPDAHGVRWPSKISQTHEVSDPTMSTLKALAPGFQCPHAADAPASVCITPPTPALSITWPKGAKVTVPFKLVGGEILIEVLLDGRKVWAFLDSGAGITVVDAEMPAAQTFQPAITVTGTGASQTLKFGLGELPRVELAGIVLSHLPVASVPIPALAAFGATRPEVILGYSLFTGAAIKVDYAKQQLELARAADSLTNDKMIALPVEDLEGKLIAKSTIEGHDAAVEVDTGNNAGFAFFKSWTDQVKLTDGHKTIDVVVRSGAGTTPTKETELRIKTAMLGPIHYDDRIANINDPPGMGFVAGLVGNSILSRCSAVVFDHAHRTLWLEGPCDRPMKPEPMTGMHMTRKEDASDAKTKGLPWIVEAVETSGPAETAGVLIGDRLASVDGKAASGDVEVMHAAFDKPEGRKVVIEVLRGPKLEKKKLVIVLAPALK